MEEARARRRAPSTTSAPRAFGLDARLIGAALLLVCIAVGLADPGPVAAMRHGAFDVYQQIAPRQPQSAPVVIVDIDERSLAAHGQWPWPRTLMAELIDRLSALGPVVIGLDFLFAEPDRLSPHLLADALPALDAAARDRLRAAPSNDAVFAAAIARSRVVVGQSGVRAGGGQEGGPETSIAVLRADPDVDPRAFLVQFPERLRNVAEIEAAAAGRGLFTLAPERDGVVRRAPAVAVADGAIAPSLAVEVLRVATGEQSLVVSAGKTGVRDVVIGNVAAPTDPQGRVWVHFAPPDPGRYVSAADVLSGDVAPAAVAGKLVLIGISAIGLFDLRETPIDPALPGVEVHAQLLETLIEGAQLARVDYAIGVELTLVLCLGLAILHAAPRLNASRAAWFGLASCAAVIASSWYFYAQHRLLFDPSFPLWTALLALGGVAFVNYRREEKERTWIRTAFSHYLAPEVVARLAQKPDALRLGGETRRITVLFADIRGFTALSEARQDDPEGLTALINQLMTPLSEAIVDRGGTIDKYMGDGVMAFWNAPTDVADHERLAAEAALEMQRRVAALNHARREAAAAVGVRFHPLSIGVGLNTGPAVVGNMGSEMRFDYSALGDPVNLANRLEGLTEEWGAAVILGETTAAAVGDRLAVLELGRTKLKGKSEPQRVFALVGGAERARSAEFQTAKPLVRQLFAPDGEATAAETRCALDALGADSFGPENVKLLDRLRRLTQPSPPHQR